MSIAFCNCGRGKPGELGRDAELQTDAARGRELTHLDPLEARRAERGFWIDVRRFRPHREISADQGDTKALGAEYWQHS